MFAAKKEKLGTLAVYALYKKTQQFILDSDISKYYTDKVFSNRKVVKL